jgi:hypothetical protein
MGVGRYLIRIVVSLVGAVVPLLFLSGSYSPVGSYLPYLPNLLGKEGVLYASLQGAIGTSFPVGILPFGTAGVTGIVLYQVVQRVLGGITAATNSSPKIDPSQMLRSMQGAMPWMKAQAAVPRSLPPDMTMSQYTILSTYQGGRRKSKDVAKILSMDKRSVESETNVLRNNGYLTKNNSLTTKGFNTLS